MVMHTLVVTLLFVAAADDGGSREEDAPRSAPDDVQPLDDGGPSPFGDDTAPDVTAREGNAIDTVDDGSEDPAHENALDGDALPVVDEHSPPSADGAPSVEKETPSRLLYDDPCRAFVEASDLKAAIACTRDTPPLDDDDRERLLERIRVLESLDAPRTDVARFTLQSFLLSGRPELVLGSAVHGAVLAPFGLVHGAYVVNSVVGGLWTRIPWQILTPLSAVGSSVAIASPLVGGTLGLVGGVLLAVSPRLLTDGDADFFRTALVVSAFNLALSAGYSTIYPRPPWERDLGFAHVPTINTGIALASFIAPLLGAGALVAVVDMPEGGGAAGLTTGALAAVLSLLLLGAVDVNVIAWVPLTLVGVSAHVAYISTVGLSFLYPFHRMTTWLVDIGALAGFLASAALVLGIPAGNPVAGYGGMAVGMMSGALGGLLLSELVPFVVDVLPSLDDAVSVPLMLPSLDGRSVGVGMAIASPFDSSPLAWR